MPKKKGQGDCGGCGARCCRYVVVEIHKPRRRIDREEVRWFLAHENVVVFRDNDDKTWNVQFLTPCRHLDKRNHCRIYADRYEVCRDYDTETCEASDKDLNALVFRCTGDFDAWWEEKKAQKRKKREKRRKKNAKKGRK